MIRLTDSAIMSLMTAYVPFFIEDFAAETLSHLTASYPIEAAYLQEKVSEETKLGLESMSLSMTNPNSATRFLCECATHALTNEIANPQSRAVYDQIKVMPSSHHEMLTQMAYNAADLYRTTLDVTVMGIVAKEAKSVSDLIQAQAAGRVSQTETGGSVKHFNWGVLSDGMWLNQALQYSYDAHRIFRPGADADLSWSRDSFDAARRHTYMPGLPRDERMEANASYEMLLAHANPAYVAQPLSSQAHQLVDLMFKDGALDRTLDNYAKGLSQPKAMVEAVGDLSAHVQLIAHLRTVAADLGSDVISQTVVDRLNRVDNVLTMALVGFEALRETRFADSLILYVDGEGEDPTVDVFVNRDVVRAFEAKGGMEQELVKIGNHLDPRRGAHTPSAGWSNDWVLERKDAIIAQVIQEDGERLEQLRRNDSAVIRDVVETNLTKVAESFSQACGQESLTHATGQEIRRIARTMISEDAGSQFSLMTETTNLLCSVIGDPFVERAATKFVSYASHEDETVRQNAKALTVMSAAVADILEEFSVVKSD